MPFEAGEVEDAAVRTRQVQVQRRPDLGQLIGESQQNVAFWEQSEKPPRSDVLPRLAEVLGVDVAELLEPGRRTGPKKSGPVGRVRRVFEEVSRLPRRQQDKVIEVVDAMIQQYRQRKTG